MRALELAFAAMLGASGPALAAAAGPALPAAPSYNGFLGVLSGGLAPGDAEGGAEQAGYRSPTALVLAGPRSLWVLDQGGRRLRPLDLRLGRLGPMPRELGAALESRPAQWLAWDAGRQRLIAGAAGPDCLSWDGDRGLKRLRLPGALRALAPLSATALGLEADGSMVSMAWGEGGSVGEARSLPLGRCLALCGLTGGAAVLQSETYGAQVALLRLDAAGNTLETDAITAGLAAGLTDTASLGMSSAELEPGEERNYFSSSTGDLLYVHDFGWPVLIHLPVPNGTGTVLAEQPAPRGLLHPWGPVGSLAVDGSRRLVYLADRDHHRILWLRDQDFWADAFGSGSRSFTSDFGHGLEKTEGTRRLLMYGTSYSFFTNPTGSKYWGLDLRLQHYLNQPALTGPSPNYEVLFGGAPLGGGGDGYSYAWSRVAEHARKFKPDALVLVQTPMDLFYALYDFFNGLVLDSEDSPGVDPEFLLQDKHAGMYHGLALEFYQELSRNADHYKPDLLLNAAGSVTFPDTTGVFRFYREPVFRSFLERAGLELLGRVKKAADEAMPGKPKILLFSVARNFLADTENSAIGPMAGTPGTQEYDASAYLRGAAKLGFEVVDLTAAVKRNATAYYPMFGTDDHLATGGVELTAILGAQGLRGVLEGAPAAPAKAHAAARSAGGDQ